MPEYLAPGVYIEEVNVGPRPIEGVSTSTAGFVGQTVRGPTGVRLVTSWADFTRWYGGLIDEEISFLPYAIQGFFANGGRRAFVARITRDDAMPGVLDLATEGASQLHVETLGPGQSGGQTFVRVRKGARDGLFRLQIIYYDVLPPLVAGVPVDPLDSKKAGDPNRRQPTMIEDFKDLSINPLSSGYVINTVNASSRLVRLKVLPEDAPLDLLTELADFTQLAGAGNGNNPVTSQEYIGTGANDPSVPSDQRSGLSALEMIDEISLLCVPDEVHPSLDGANRSAVRDEVINQCERLRDRFAILQIEKDQGNVPNIPQPPDTQFAAVYYPWIRMMNVETNEVVLVPPGGHVTGIYARTDIERGVHKAPANEVVRGILSVDLDPMTGPLEFKIDKGQHDILNPRGINVIRDFRSDQRGIRVWGARTLSSEPLWRYVNVRRLFIFVEESVEEAMQWVVFEPNDEPLWAQVRRTIEGFLIRVWKSGALQGLRPEHAFFVRCDRTTMTEDDILNGRLICEVGLAPVRPAEFVIFRFQQFTLEAQQA